MRITKYLLLLILFMQPTIHLLAQEATLKKGLSGLKTSMETLGLKLKDFGGKLGTLKESLKDLKEKAEAQRKEKLRKLKEENDKLIANLTEELLSSFNKTLDKTPQFDETILEKMAVEDGYGYKTSNLQLMKELVETLATEYKKTSFTIKIPELCGISSQEIQKFLSNHGIDVKEKWASLTKSITASDQEQAFKTKKFPTNFLENLKKIEEEIEKKFNALLPGLKSEKSFDSLFSPSFQPKTIETLNTLLIKDCKYMVRSTAKEDTDKLANAGGNESVANVTPTVEEIVKALKIVVASYFGSKSTKQRLDAGDRSLFNDNPFTPALVQRMIGEKLSAKTNFTLGFMPSCGVMFTE